MMDQVASEASVESVIATLREELGQSDSAVNAFAPILHYLVMAGDMSFVSEEILARIRAIITGLAIQLLDALASNEDPHRHSDQEIDAVGSALLDNPALVKHIHAITLEWQLAERLQNSLAFDPVMSSGLEKMITSQRDDVNRLAKAFLSSQARWSQHQRQMRLSLMELPADLLNVALYTLRTLAGVEPTLAERAAVVEKEIRTNYDEKTTRLGLAQRLVSINSEENIYIVEYGVTLFLTFFAIKSKMLRDAVTLSTHEGQLVRLMLTLRMAGLPWADVKEHAYILHPNSTIPHNIELLRNEDVAVVLSSSAFQSV